MISFIIQKIQKYYQLSSNHGREISFLENTHNLISHKIWWALYLFSKFSYICVSKKLKMLKNTNNSKSLTKKSVRTV